MNGHYPSLIPIRDPDPLFGVWPWSQGPMWRLDGAYAFTVCKEEFQQEYVIPDGYEFDGQSVPGVLHGFPFYYGPAGVGMRAGLIHDFLCDLYQGGSDWLRVHLGHPLPPCPPAQTIHAVYYDIQLADNQRPAKAKATWLAVSLFGPGGRLRPRCLDRRRADVW